MNKRSCKNNVTKVGVILLIVLFSYTLLSLIAAAAVCGAIFERAAAPGPAPASCPRQTVTLDGGVTAYLYGEPSAAHGLLVLTYGLRSLPDDHMAEILFFAQNGWAVLLPDAAATAKGFPAYTAAVIAAVGYARQTSALSSLPLVMYGHSAGGYGSVGALSRVTGVRAVVAAAAFDRPIDLMTATAESTVGPLADLQVPFLFLYQSMLFGADANASAAEAALSCDVPILLIEGERDEAVPGRLGLGAKLAGEKNVSCLLLPERGHTDLLLTDAAVADRAGTPRPARSDELNATLMAQILAFFEEHIR